MLGADWNIIEADLEMKPQNNLIKLVVLVVWKQEHTFNINILMIFKKNIQLKLLIFQ